MKNFLKALYLDWFYQELADSFFEIRHVPYPNPNQTAFPRFFRSPVSPSQWKGHHLFFSVNPRKIFGDSRNISHVVALYVDIETKDTKTLDDVGSFQPAVSCVISSGRGIHCYWFLDEPIKVEDATQVSAILKGLSKRLNGDPAATSISQNLRLPGSLNPKNNQICGTIFLDLKRRYDIDEFSHLAIRQSVDFSFTIENVSNISTGDVPNRFRRLLQSNDPIRRIWTSDKISKYKTGSERDFALAMKLAWRDYTSSEIASILLAASYNKKYERNLHYVSRTALQACARVEQAKLKRLSVSFPL